MSRSISGAIGIVTVTAFMVLTPSGVLARQFIRLAGQELSTTPDLNEEKLPLGPVAKEVMAMTTTGGKTVVTCVAYSPDGKTLAVGDGPNHPICTLGGPAPINPNGGLIHLVDTTTRRVRATLVPTKRAGHEYQIDRIWFSRDGSRLISYGLHWVREGDCPVPSANLTAWDVAPARPRARGVVPVAVRIPWELDVDRDGTSFVVVEHDSTVHICDVDAGDQRWAFRGGSEPRWLATFVKYSTDGRTLAVGTREGDVILKDAASGRTLGSFSCRSRDGNKTDIYLLAFSRDGHYLAVGAQFSERPPAQAPPSSPAQPPEVNSALTIIDMIARRVIARLPVQKSAPWASFTPDGTGLVAVSEWTLKIWDTATGAERASFQRGGTFVFGCALSPDGTVLATGEDHAIRLVELATGKERAVLKTWGRVEQVAFQPDGKWLTGTGYALKTWDLRAALTPRFDEGHTDEVTAVAYAPDGKAIASASEDRTVKIWDLVQRKPRATLRGHEAEVTAVVYTPDGKSVISASLDRTVRIWDATNGKERVKLLGHTRPITSAAVSPDSQMIASGCQPEQNIVGLTSPSLPGTLLDAPARAPVRDFGEVKLWDITTGRLKATPLDHVRVARSTQTGPRAIAGRAEYIASPPIVTFSPEGVTLAIGKEDGTIDLWEIAAGKARTLPSAAAKDLVGFPDILCLSYSPDGRRLAAGARDSTIHVWDMSPTLERPLATLGHGDYVVAVAFSPDGRYLAGTDRNGTIKLWSAGTWREAGRVQSDPLWFTSLAFSPDGKSLAGGHRNKDILIYPVDRMLNAAR